MTMTVCRDDVMGGWHDLVVFTTRHVTSRHVTSCASDAPRRSRPRSDSELEREIAEFEAQEPDEGNMAQGVMAWYAACM